MVSEVLFLFGLGVISWTQKTIPKYQTCDSEYKNIKCGIPHGSILGPLLFILFANAIANTTSLTEISLFPEDTISAPQ